MQTTFHGIELRSKTERAWAKWFTKEGWHWRYELVTFGHRETYTPDFYLLKYDLFIEIKVEYGRKLNNFELCQWPLLLIFGTPDRHYAYFKARQSNTFDRRMTDIRPLLQGLRNDHA